MSPREVYTDFLYAVGCTLLSDPVNGMVVLTPGDMATYSCDPGYMLVGSTILTCGNDSMWNDDPPVCEPMGNEQNYIYLPHLVILKIHSLWNIAFCNHCHANYSTCLIIVGVMCPDLDDIPNGSMSQGGSTPGDMATYSCDAKFELVGAPKLTCQQSGMWDNPPPTCECKSSLLVYFYFMQADVLPV